MDLANFLMILAFNKSRSLIDPPPHHYQTHRPQPVRFRFSDNLVNKLPEHWDEWSGNFDEALALTRLKPQIFCPVIENRQSRVVQDHLSRVVQDHLSWVVHWELPRIIYRESYTENHQSRVTLPRIVHRESSTESYLPQDHLVVHRESPYLGSSIECRQIVGALVIDASTASSFSASQGASMWPASEGFQGVRLEDFRHIVPQGSSIDLSFNVKFGADCVDWPWSTTRKSSRLLVLWLGTFIRVMTLLVAVETGDMAQVFADPARPAGRFDTGDRSLRVSTMPLFLAI